MRSTLRWALAATLMSLGCGSPTEAQEPPETGSSSRPSASPIRDSVDRVVEKVLRSRLRPCEQADREGIPCFPVTVEEEGPRFSVAEALRRYRGTGSPAPGPPTVAETQRQLSGAPLSASGGVGFDPVCTTKNLVKKLSGRATTYHLYRVRDGRGEWPLLTDRPLDPQDDAANTDSRYEYLGKFDGECAAVAAWRQALRKAREPAPLPADWDEAKEPPP